jgi:ubiquinone/menaquinone biosynthesis C-methylase UbiE
MTSMAMDNVVVAFEEAAAAYDRVGVDFFGPFGEELVRRAGIRPGERVLDVGCGRGAVLFPAARAVGPDGHVIGTDAAPSMVELTRAEAARHGFDHVTVDVGDAQDPAVPAGSVDVVTAGLVLFMLADPHAALRAYGRILRPGGRLALSTFASMDPDLGRAMRAMARHLPADATPPPAVDPMFGSTEATVAAVADAGFRDITCTEFSVESRFTDKEHWLAWCWSHGARAILRQIPAERLAAATTDAFEVMWGDRKPGGDLTMTTTIRVIVGTTANLEDVNEPR